MNTLRRRLGLHEKDYWAEGGQAHEQVETFKQLFERQMRRVEWADERDERQPNVTGSKREREQTANGIKRRYIGLAATLDECYERFGMTPAEFDNARWADTVDQRADFNNVLRRLDAGDSVPEIPSDRQRYLNDMRADLRANILYALYLEQLFSDTARPVSQSYAVFSLYLAIKAAIVLLAERPNGHELLRVDFDMRDKAVVFNQWLDLNEPDNPDEMVEEAIRRIPGIYGCANQILSEYAKAVRVERNIASQSHKATRVIDTPLPDEEEGGLTDKERTRIESAVRMSRAIAAYASGERSIKNIAREYRVDHGRLSDEIKRSGVSVQHGGDRLKG